jgi:hypothetical protein
VNLSFGNDKRIQWMELCFQNLDESHEKLFGPALKHASKELNGFLQLQEIILALELNYTCIALALGLFLIESFVFWIIQIFFMALVD